MTATAKHIEHILHIHVALMPVSNYYYIENALSVTRTHIHVLFDSHSVSGSLCFLIVSNSGTHAGADALLCLLFYCTTERLFMTLKMLFKCWEKSDLYKLFP